MIVKKIDYDCNCSMPHIQYSIIFASVDREIIAAAAICTCN